MSERTDDIEACWALLPDALPGDRLSEAISSAITKAWNHGHMRSEVSVGGYVETVGQAMCLLGLQVEVEDEETDHLLEGRRELTSAGIDSRGRAWAGFGRHENDRGEPVVAPSVVVFLPFILKSLAGRRHPSPARTTTSKTNNEDLPCPARPARTTPS